LFSSGILFLTSQCDAVSSPEKNEQQIELGSTKERAGKLSLGNQVLNLTYAAYGQCNPLEKYLIFLRPNFTVCENIAYNIVVRIRGNNVNVLSKCLVNGSYW
jgi:hypothetical protein